MPPNRTAAYERAPLDDLLAILLRQFKRPLLTHGVTLSDSEAAEIASAAVQRADMTEKAQTVRDALVDLVAESEGVLARWNLTFEQSLQTEMSDIPGWTTTAEFLEIANEKANAELRISTGAALMVALGDTRRAHHLLHIVEHSGADADLDEVIARRVLLFASGIMPDQPDWLDKLRAWVGEQRSQ
jgi:Arc/MetJ family transcription regulator